MPDPDESETETINPRGYSNLGIMACFHKKYTLGDTNTDPSRKKCLDIDEVVSIEITKKCGTEKGGIEDCLVIPLWMMDHGGLTISASPFTCKWDSGRIGIIYAPYSAIKRQFGVDRITDEIIGWAKEALLKEVEDYNAFIA